MERIHYVIHTETDNPVRDRRAKSGVTSVDSWAPGFRFYVEHHPGEIVRVYEFARSTVHKMSSGMDLTHAKIILLFETLTDNAHETEPTPWERLRAEGVGPWEIAELLDRDPDLAQYLSARLMEIYAEG